MKSVLNMEWKNIVPDKNNDWINQRDESYENYLALYREIFAEKAVGVVSSRDAWVYGFSYAKVRDNSEKMINNYNQELDRLKNNYDISLLNHSGNFVKWSRGLKQKFSKGKNRFFTRCYNYWDISSIY